MKMGKSENPGVYVKEGFDLDNNNDRLEIMAFEKELDPYFEKSVMMFGREVKGFWLYLHEKGLFRYSRRYPDGAVNFNCLAAYQTANQKYEALGKLKDRRKFAQEEDNQRVEAMAPVMG